ncbi:MAG: hypothetical protein J5929_00735 [Eubacterium sp.]|nr:hypothetical protein [Eubacterium sp.]
MENDYLKKMLYTALIIMLAATAVLVIYLLKQKKPAEKKTVEEKTATTSVTDTATSVTDTASDGDSITQGFSAAEKQEYAERYRKTVESQKYIIHALGGMNGTDNYINSIDPLRLIYAKGYRLFEADVSFTSDGRLVLAHSGQGNVWTKSDWKDRLGQDYPFDSSSKADSSMAEASMTDSSLIDSSTTDATSADKHLCDYETFMGFRIQKKYKATSFRELVGFMAEHKDMFVMIDGGERSFEDTKAYYSAVLNETREEVRELSVGLTADEEDAILRDVLGRMVVGGQTIEMLNAVKEVYDFPLINFYYNSNEKREGELCKPIDFIHYCDDNGVSSFSVAKDVYDQQTAQALEKSTLMSFVFTVNDPAEEARINAYGADIIGTDFLWDEQE